MDREVGSGWSARSSEYSMYLFRLYRRTRDRTVRDRLFAIHGEAGEFHVKRFSGRGVPTDDLRQVARLCVLRAIDRFDPDRGVEFATFASRTVEGEFKRYFRDRTWLVRPPRRSQELHLALRRAEEELLQHNGRSPTVDELSDAVGESVEHVLAALEARGAQRGVCLDGPRTVVDDRSTPMHDFTPSSIDQGYGQVEDRAVLVGLLAHLAEREREILFMRFFENRTQEDIAERMGMSQSYLSRVLRRVLSDLRIELDGQIESTSSNGSPRGVATRAQRTSGASDQLVMTSR